MNELILHVNVHAKTADNPENRIVGGHDYRGIGEAADLVAVMTIDYGYPTGPPEPISPLWWMGEVLRYALLNIPEYKLQSAFPDVWIRLDSTKQRDESFISSKCPKSCHCNWC
ncbi:hypothetical protein RCO48_16065 [Peribacillus frigoritolerans]|nr:hypothetical protein [Peribacillus frigoritolerans]